MKDFIKYIFHRIGMRIASIPMRWTLARLDGLKIDPPRTGQVFLVMEFFNGEVDAYGSNGSVSIDGVHPDTFRAVGMGKWNGSEYELQLLRLPDKMERIDLQSLVDSNRLFIYFSVPKYCKYKQNVYVWNVKGKETEKAE